MINSAMTPSYFSSKLHNLWTKLPPLGVLLILITVSLFASVAITIAYTATTAYAACTGGGGVGLDGNTGTVGTEDNCTTPVPDPAPAVTQTGTENSNYTKPAFDPHHFTYRVGCGSYLGPAGGGEKGWGVDDYQRSSNCLILRASVSLAATLQEVEKGIFADSGQSNTVTYDGSTVRNLENGAWDSCNAQGENSAYAKDYIRTVSAVETWKTTIKIYSNGTFDSKTELISTSYISDSSGIKCVYPQPIQGAAKDCFYNYNGTSHYSQNKDTIKNDGNLVKTRGALAGDPNAPVWNGSETTEPTCDRTGSADVKISQNLEENGYGYYRLRPSYSYQKYVRTDWVGDNRTFYSKWTNPNGGNGSKINWFSYSCSADKPFEGPFSYGTLPDRTANFDPASCPQVNWQCELEDSTTVGLDRAIIPAGQTKVTIPVTVMRNGESIPLTFSKLRVVDYTAGAGVNVTNGVTGSGVRNVTGIDYKSNVASGSTPFYGTDVNSNSQYFKQYESFDTRDIEKWDVWLSNANTNVAKGISFNWASEGDASFAAERQYRVTAEFYVPRGTTIDSDGNAGSYGYKWIRDTKNCYEYDASGNQTFNMLTAVSNPTNVVRSVGDTN